MGVVIRFKKWRKQNNKITGNTIKAENYYNKAFIKMQKQNNNYIIVCNAYDLLNDYTITITNKSETKRIYNTIKGDLSKIIDMSMYCFNKEIQQGTLLIDCTEFKSKWKNTH